MRSRFFFAALLVAWVVLTPRAGTAHPLGNFSISHYSGIRIGREAIEVFYFIDMAEIPTFQEIQETGIVPKAGDSSLDIYLMRKAEALGEGLLLEVSGQRLSLHAESKEIIFPPGAGGLPTMKIGIRYKGRLDGATPAGLPNILHYQDRNFPGRAGWKEIIAVPGSGIKLLSSTAPEVDRSSRLSDYPTDLLNSPPQDLEARVTFTTTEVSGPVAVVKTALPPSGLTGRESGSKPSETIGPYAKQPLKKSFSAKKNGAVAMEVSPAIEDGPQGPTDSVPVRLQANQQSTPRSSFTELMATKRLGIGIILIALAVAVGLGAVHALEPGHGKTLVAAYLVGSRGTMKHALCLGLIVTAAHTAGVYLLGGVTLYATQYVVPERLYPWLGLVSGVMTISLGLVLFFRRYLKKDGVFSQHHDHGNHSHSSDHGHYHELHRHSHHHAHTHHHHEPGREASLRELLALGISGGIVPCPAALVVLLSAVSMQRVGFGLLLIVAFSIGLAAVLIALGVLMVYARRFMSRFQGEGTVITRWLPLTSAAVITLFGLAMTVQSLATAGIL